MLSTYLERIMLNTKPYSDYLFETQNLGKNTDFPRLHIEIGIGTIQVLRQQRGGWVGLAKC